MGTQAVGTQVRASACPTLLWALVTQPQSRPGTHLSQAAPLSAAGGFCQRCKVRVYFSKKEINIHLKGGFKSIKVGVFLLTADDVCVCVCIPIIITLHCT